MIKLENVSKYYNTNNNVAIGIRKVNLSLTTNEFVVITGASGSGKTTLLNVISGMDKYEEGTMYVNGEDTSYFSETEYENYRNEYISFIFQNYNLIDSYSVYENVELALVVKGKTKEERHQHIISIIEKVGLKNRLNYKVSKLSGGERQRVAIARALASEALIIACDEITGNLDHQTGIEIIKLLKSVSENKLVLLVTHNPEEALPYATRLIRMYDGSVTNDEVITRVEDSTNLQVTPTKPIKSSELMKIGFKNLINTPRKTILMFIILLTTALFISLSFALYDKTEFDSDYDYIDYSVNRYQGRLVVKKPNNEELESSDLEYLKKINGVKNLIVDDVVLDNMLQIDFNLEGKSHWDSVFDFYMRSADDLNKSNLTYGKLPSAENEIVLSLNQKILTDLDDLIGTTIKVDVVSGFPYEFLVTGIIFDELTRNNLYTTTDFMKTVRPAIESANSSTHFDNPEKNKEPFFYFGDLYCAYYEDPDVSDDEMIIESNSFDFQFKVGDGEQPEKDLVLNVIYENPFHKVVFENKKIKFITASDEDMKYRYNPTGLIRISPTNYQALNLGKSHQISLTVNEKNNINQIVDTINNNGYLSFHTAIKSDDGLFTIVELIFRIFILGVSVLLMVVVYLIAYLALKNVMMSKKKDYLVMRSLGVKSGKIKKIVYAEVIGLTLTAALFWIISIVLIKQYTSSRFLSLIRQFNFFDMVVIFLIMAFLALLLAIRFGNKIVKETIVTRFVN